MKKSKLIFLIALASVLAGVFIVPLFAKSILKFIYPIKYEVYVLKYSKQYNLDPYFVFAIIKTESNFRKDVKSSREAKGLMQVSSITGKWGASKLGIKNYTEDILYNPEQNIRIGCWYIGRLNQEFQLDSSKVLAAYNGGSGNVNKWIKDYRYSKDGKHLNTTPFKETNNFIRKVNAAYNTYLYLYKKDNVK
jgi:soluble lytic murein transglycosylase